MMSIERDMKVSEIFKKYDDGIAPLEEWMTSDISALITVLDEELQVRAEQAQALASEVEVILDEYNEDDDNEIGGYN